MVFIRVCSRPNLFPFFLSNCAESQRLLRFQGRLFVGLVRLIVTTGRWSLCRPTWVPSKSSCKIVSPFATRVEWYKDQSGQCWNKCKQWIEIQRQSCRVNCWPLWRGRTRPMQLPTSNSFEPIDQLRRRRQLWRGQSCKWKNASFPFQYCHFGSVPSTRARLLESSSFEKYEIN